MTAAAAEPWVDEARGRIADLHPSLHELANAWIELAGGSRSSARFIHRFNPEPVDLQATAAIDDLGLADRVGLFRALHPTLGEFLATWWHQSLTSAYVYDLYGRGYRSAVLPGASEQRRCIELAWLLRLASGRTVGPLDLASEAVQSGDGDVLGGPLTMLVRAASDEAAPLVRMALEAATGAPGTTLHPHLVQVLLEADDDEARAAVEALLLDPGREQGRRAAVLESAGYAPLSVLLSIAELVLTRGLVATELGLGFVNSMTRQFHGVGDEASAARNLERRIEILSDSRVRLEALNAGGPSTKEALDALFVIEASEAIAAASKLVREVPADRLVAVGSLVASRLEAADQVLLKLVRHDDFSVAVEATLLGRFRKLHVEERSEFQTAVLELFERLEAANAMDDFADALVGRVAGRWDPDSLEELLPFMGWAGAGARRAFCNCVREADVVPDGVVDLLVSFLAARDSETSSEASIALYRVQVTAKQSAALEKLLERKSGRVRSRALKLLTTLSAEDALHSAQRLWARRKAGLKDAACELLAAIDDPVVEKMATTWFADATEHQRTVLASRMSGNGWSGDGGSGAEEKVEPQTAPLSRSDGVPALVDVGEVLGVQLPATAGRAGPLVSAAAGRLVAALDEFVEEHRDREVESGESGRVALRDASRLRDPMVNQHRYSDNADPALLGGDLFRDWFAGRPKSLRSSAGDEAVRALLAIRPHLAGRRSYSSDFRGPAGGALGAHWVPVLGRDVSELRHPVVVAHVLGWLAHETATSKAISVCIDASIRQAHGLFEADFVDPGLRNGEPSTRALTTSPWFNSARQLLVERPELATPELVARLWELCRWLDVGPVPNNAGTRSGILELAASHGVGGADEYAEALRQGGGALRKLTRSLPKSQRSASPLASVVDAYRQEIITGELERGELPGPLSSAVFGVASVPGASAALALLAKLGRRKLSPEIDVFAGEVRSNLIHLLRVAHPTDGDTPETVRVAIAEHALSEERLVEFALFAPQWASLLEDAVSWSGLDRAVHWVHAHSSIVSDELTADRVEAWYAQVSGYTVLTAEQLLGGEIDVSWFREAYNDLGDERWQLLMSLAAASMEGRGYRRAQIFSQVMTGQLSMSECKERIAKKRDQNLLRAFGLVPLPTSAKARTREINDRYRYLVDFRSSSNASGPQRRRSEQAACAVAIANLARNAGHANPLRFAWQMESVSITALVSGASPVVVDDVSVELVVEPDGSPILTVHRGDRALKSVPAATKKKPAVAELVARRDDLQASLRTIRATLEQAMVDGEWFEVDDLAALQQHPLVAPAIAALLFVDQRGTVMRPAEAGFRSAANRLVKPRGEMRVAHPHDLYVSSTWGQWRRLLIEQRVRQPFRQVFREHYVPRPDELAGSATFDRYAGRRIEARRARALLLRRGWNFDYDNAVFARSFHAEGVTVHLCFENGFFAVGATALPVVDTVEVVALRSWRLVDAKDVAPRIFAEAMRDIDLAVSVAHDPRGPLVHSQSTLETRTALAEELVGALGVDNVTFGGHHAVVKGVRGHYRIHMGSGVVHEDTSGQIVLHVPRAEHDRVFLPFVDDDPRTAQILSTILLLADDAHLADPTILEQLRATL